MIEIVVTVDRGVADIDAFNLDAPGAADEVRLWIMQFVRFDARHQLIGDRPVEIDFHDFKLGAGEPTYGLSLLEDVRRAYAAQLAEEMGEAVTPAYSAGFNAVAAAHPKSPPNANLTLTDLVGEIPLSPDEPLDPVERPSQWLQDDAHGGRRP